VEINIGDEEGKNKKIFINWNLSHSKQAEENYYENPSESSYREEEKL